MPDRLTADMVVARDSLDACVTPPPRGSRSESLAAAQMTMLTPTSKPMVHRFVTVLLKQNPPGPCDVSCRWWLFGAVPPWG